ncbi:MAG: iron-sulfur cluster repair di-iron protein [Saprospiraceae bacterium]|nr:iron-sulfur cluster repair di-iron protein [Saprospiraceae bacterium]
MINIASDHQKALTIDEDTPVGQIVAHDFRSARVFNKHGIDFCCKGSKTIKEVCLKSDLAPTLLLDQLLNVINSKKENGVISFKELPLDLLVDYIVKVHHRYVNEHSQVLVNLLDKLCKVHGNVHPELFEVRNLFTASTEDLLTHMAKEEQVLFPMIKFLTQRFEKGNTDVSEIQALPNIISAMNADHEQEGDRFREIENLTGGYTVPADGCTTYSVAYAMLKEFESDLHVHIHLENNILFPRALAMSNVSAETVNN